MRRRFLPTLLTALLLLPAPPAGAWYPRLAAESTIPAPEAGLAVGSNRPYLVAPGETLMEIAYRGGLGFDNLRRANPGQDPWQPRPGSDLLLPYRTLLPPGIGPGITVNLAEYRLYLVWPEAGAWRVRIYAIGLGREGWTTPLGTFRVVSAARAPSWTPPPALRAENPQLPAMVPPGPDNPLGEFWLGLSAEGIGIHGTNRPYGIGRRVSHGCIRLYPRDIRDLATRVTLGAPARIVYEPVKVGVVDGRLLAEVHPDYLERAPDPAAEIRRQAAARGREEAPDPGAIRRLVEEAAGVPVPLPAAPAHGP